VRFAVEHEFARTVSDVLARRSRALFLNAGQAQRLAPAVAQEMTALGIAHPDPASLVQLAKQYQTCP
jgi:glycerol-3-phosphate dehydrogenase